jgi:hypothetical protein
VRRYATLSEQIVSLSFGALPRRQASTIKAFSSCTKQSKMSVEACCSTGTAGVPAFRIPRPRGWADLACHKCHTSGTGQDLCTILCRIVTESISCLDTYKLTALAINAAPSFSVYYEEPNRSRVSCVDAMQVWDRVCICMSSALGSTARKLMLKI